MQAGIMLPWGRMRVPVGEWVSTWSVQPDMHRETSLISRDRRRREGQVTQGNGGRTRVTELAVGRM